jgi:hypothetical protein
VDHPLPIIGDVPSSNPRLGFEVYANALASALRNGIPAQFTIGIYGAWGSGKSSLLNAIEKELARDENVLVVRFDAWRYERSEHIIVPLMHAIDAAVPRFHDPTLKQKVGKALTAIVRSVTFTLGPVAFAPAAAIDEYAGPEALNAAYSEPYADMRAIAEELGSRRIAVLVDDLDRCSPDKVVSLLEAINLVMDVPGFVFTLALDYDVLVKAVAARYPHTSGHVFIEKMVQVPFRVPRLDLKRDGFLEELIPDWADHSVSFPGGFTYGAEFSNIAYDVATLGLEANPRQVKRFINSLFVLLRVAESRLGNPDPRLLAGLVGLQLRWPAEYQDLVSSVYAEDANPFEDLFKGDQPNLVRFSREFFEPHGATVDALRGLIQLTETVSTPEASSGYETGEYASSAASAVEIRASNEEQLRNDLIELGYQRNPRYPNSYYHPQHSNYRVTIRKTVARLERRNEEGQWSLARSFLLTREMAELTTIIRDVNGFVLVVDNLMRRSRVATPDLLDL